MFSRRLRRPTSPELLTAWECLDSGDVPGALRRLRQAPEPQPLAEVALVVARAAEAAGFDDLHRAATAVTAQPDKARTLYDYGYACVERGVSHLAIPALREAVRLAPDSPAALRELVSAYEDEGRHREAADLLAAREGRFDEWPDRYLLVFNAVLAGDLGLARHHHALLPAPDDTVWLPARDRQNRVLDRAASAEAVSTLDRTDLRGWQYVMGGTVLGTHSPYGFGAGMAGRFAYLQDTHDTCLQGLLRLKAVLHAAQVRPRSVSLLPDRGSRILGLAAAEVLGLPAEPFDAGRQDTVVIAYDLNRTAEADQGAETLGRLFDRAPGQVLHEHASCWTDTPAVTPDSVTLLHQTVVAPWGEGLRQTPDGGVERTEPDERPEAEIAAEIVAADPTPDQGDGETPADPVERLTDFVTAVRGTWLRGDRARVKSSGPVSSPRFR
ncbi:tetratricopeptide repeat protein [Streptomyces sp. NPDC051315]|uniref:tetratricopeptide repeat protein n=1 Tax=Streptomyces sp. NPDC051315 TaxID=3365650 RepID=UPI0037B166A8